MARDKEKHKIAMQRRADRLRVARKRVASWLLEQSIDEDIYKELSLLVGLAKVHTVNNGKRKETNRRIAEITQQTVSEFTKLILKYQGVHESARVNGVRLSTVIEDVKKELGELHELTYSAEHGMFFLRERDVSSS